ncbi:DUF4835 family protein [bacterium]|nr:DUF4835 family protein [bacterium]
MKLTFYKFFVLLLMLSLGSNAYGQKIVAKVKVIHDKLQGRNLDLFEGFEQKLTSYLNDYNWSQTDDQTPLNLEVQVFLEKVIDEGGAKTVSATIYFSNSKELQYLDNGCIFVLKKGYTFYHNDNVIDPLLSIIDFYVNIMLGDEMDTLGKFLGTNYFQRAKSIALQSKALIAYNARGWEDRLLKAELFLDPRYLDYRIMKDFFYEGQFNYEDGDITLARKNVSKAVALFQSLKGKTETAYHTERFIQVHYITICKIFEKSGDTRLFDLMIELDPKNKDTYVKYRDGKL